MKPSDVEIEVTPEEFVQLQQAAANAFGSRSDFVRRAEWILGPDRFALMRSENEIGRAPRVVVVRSDRRSDEREVRLLKKEVEFLRAREKSWRDHLRWVRAGTVTAIVNGLASPHYAHYVYLSNRLEAATTKLRALDVTEGAKAFTFKRD